MLCLTHVCQTGMKERCVNVLVLKIEWETAKITAALMNHPKKGKIVDSGTRRSRVGYLAFKEERKKVLQL